MATQSAAASRGSQWRSAQKRDHGEVHARRKRAENVVAQFRKRFLWGELSIEERIANKRLRLPQQQPQRPQDGANLFTNAEWAALEEKGRVAAMKDLRSIRPVLSDDIVVQPLAPAQVEDVANRDSIGVFASPTRPSVAAGEDEEASQELRSTQDGKL